MLCDRTELSEDKGILLVVACSIGDAISVMVAGQSDEEKARIREIRQMPGAGDILLRQGYGGPGGKIVSSPYGKWE